MFEHAINDQYAMTRQEPVYTVLTSSYPGGREVGHLASMCS